jgi:hypothetical protein
MKSLILALFMLVLVAVAAAQRSPHQSQSTSVVAPCPKLTQSVKDAAGIGLSLVLRPRDRFRPGDVNVSVRFINHGSRIMMMPQPSTGCHSVDGYIEISRELLAPAKYPEIYSVCVSDSFGKRDLPAETDRWVRLAPGAAYEIRTELAFDNPGARYKIRAKYIPANLTSEELRLLSEHGISAVQESPESKSFVVKSPNPK